MFFPPKKKLVFSVLTLFGATVLVLGIASCATVGYYTQAARGQLDLLAGRQAIAELIRSETTPPELRDKLVTVEAIRDFASGELGLPENGSYRYYVDLQRPHVVWNVVATPEFSLQPVTWCFPIAGCVSYRGFFNQRSAKKFADDLRRKGYDVYLYGVSAYSTLGWFDDPVLNTFLDRTEADLAGLIFHELAHQQVYVKNDTFFNEAFAKTVEMEGVKRWMAAAGDPEAYPRWLEQMRRDEDFIRLLLEVQKELRELYATAMADKDKRQEKERIIAGLKDRYEEWKEAWGGFKGYDRWFKNDLNNARFASINTYHAYVPAFQELLKSQSGNLTAFYREVGRIGRLPYTERTALLGRLRDTFLAEQLPEEGEPVADTQQPEGDRGV